MAEKTKWLLNSCPAFSSLKESVLLDSSAHTDSSAVCAPTQTDLFSGNFFEPLTQLDRRYNAHSQILSPVSLSLKYPSSLSDTFNLKKLEQEPGLLTTLKSIKSHSVLTYEQALALIAHLKTTPVSFFYRSKKITMPVPHQGYEHCYARAYWSALEFENLGFLGPRKIFLVSAEGEHGYLEVKTTYPATEQEQDFLTDNLTVYWSYHTALLVSIQLPNQPLAEDYVIDLGASIDKPMSIKEWIAKYSAQPEKFTEASLESQRVLRRDGSYGLRSGHYYMRTDGVSPYFPGQRSDINNRDYSKACFFERACEHDPAPGQKMFLRDALEINGLQLANQIRQLMATYINDKPQVIQKIVDLLQKAPADTKNMFKSLYPHFVERVLKPYFLHQRPHYMKILRAFN